MALPATHSQLKLDLGVEVEGDVDGIEMGVLENGMAYLTQRGLSSICGAARSTIQEITKEWEDSYGSGLEPRGRAQFFSNYLREAGYDAYTLYMEVERNGSPHYAYSEIVCMAFIEFFAFEAQRTNNTAMVNFRRLARYGLNKFIYDALGYRPTDKWVYFNDRVSLLHDASPPGHFILFKETTGMIVDLIRGGLPVSDKTIPDISVGSHWGRHWTDGGLERRFGERIKFEHNYPNYYPQSMSNPQTPWAYPDEALPEFRRWFREVYLPTKYPSYILKKANVLSGGKPQAEALASLYNPKQIGGN
ncbi:hypothetical protein ELI41_29690 (plasmid) [Rhizobium leguminosarum]|uniref:hypothetical protein n=1 Tax=Rhizobium leguminosarum TaxID=384 RepID=UPI001031A1E2|nr:hypothetical protein [Rhizobium leguminosarum]TAU80480.1 hypothetical protein ELI41_29690 [Rhizobium leguminosarum]